MLRSSFRFIRTSERHLIPSFSFLQTGPMLRSDSPTVALRPSSTLDLKTRTIPSVCITVGITPNSSSFPWASFVFLGFVWNARVVLYIRKRQLVPSLVAVIYPSHLVLQLQPNAPGCMLRMWTDWPVLSFWPTNGEQREMRREMALYVNS